MLYTIDEVNGILSKAGQFLYKMGTKAEKERWQKGESVLENECALVYDIIESVEWGKTRKFSDPEFHGVVAYLNHKVSGYGFEGIIPYFTPVTTSSSASSSASTGFQLYAQYVVGAVGAPAAGATTITDSNLQGRNIIVALNGAILAVGLADRQSYTFNKTTGVITFSRALPADDIIQIYLYLDVSSGWTEVDSFEVETGGTMEEDDTVYTNAELIGKNVSVSVNGALLPVGLSDRLSFTINQLTGAVTFNSGVINGWEIVIYSY